MAIRALTTAWQEARQLLPVINLNQRLLHPDSTVNIAVGISAPGF